jgi:hypothetical protein
MSTLLQMIRNRIGLVLFFTFRFSLFTFAQTVPNGGFENWYYYPGSIYEVPKGWTDNDLLFQRFDSGYRGISVIKSTRSHSGKYALQLGVTIDHGDTVNGAVFSTGNVDTLIQGALYHTASMGFPCSQKYATFTGYYIFDKQTGDTAVFGVILTRWDWVTRTRDTIVNSILRIGDVHNDYVPFVVPMKYRKKDEVPDTAFITIGIQSENLKMAHVGTVLIIDDLQFSGRPEGKKE